MKYIVYQITNNINGKIYIGSHKTNDINDRYMGSGKYLKRALDKHGVDNFTKKILFVFDNPDDMYNKEAELVNEDFLSEENTYNLKLGGSSGFEYINRIGLNGTSAGVTARLKLLDDLLWKEEWANKQQEGINKHIVSIDREEFSRRGTLANQTYFNKNGKYSFSGKTHTEETKSKISEAAQIHQKGNKNSQFGTCWVFREDIGNKKIKKTLLEKYLIDGWKKEYHPGYRI